MKREIGRAFILSPCGASLLLNQATEDERRLINRHSNAKSDKHMDAEVAQKLAQVIANAKHGVESSSVEKAADLSAELNGIIKYYDGNLHGRARDYHVLLSTDTWLGEQAAELAASWLRGHGLSVEVKRQKDLQTEHLDAFQLALSELVQWCEETLPGYQQNGYHTVFNLTACFKSVQGFLQTLAMFYADEVVYVFERSSELLRIPRLPVQISEKETVRKHIYVFRRLAMRLPTESDDDVPETLLMQIDGQKTLSPWGELVWQRVRSELYGDRLWPAPSMQIMFGAGFEQSLSKLAQGRIRQVNQKIDDLALYLETNQDLRSLDFKQLKNDPIPPSTHEIDAWSDQDARRIFGHYQDGHFVLDKLGDALH